MTDVKKVKYGLLILKRDQDHIIVLESDNFDEVYSLWRETKDAWTLALKEQKPFELNKPIITAFDPGLIYEVTVRPLPDVTSATSSNNPYAQKAQQEGFLSTFRGRGDMLDNGFKY